MANEAHRWLTVTAVAACLFYAATPMFYSYFDAISMNFGPVLPAELVNEPPFSFWGGLQAIYQPSTYDDPSTLLDLGCRLKPTSPAVTIETEGPTCRFHVVEGAGIFGPNVWLRPGDYVARYSLATTPDCPVATLSLDVRSDNRLSLAEASRQVAGLQTVDLPFRIAGYSAMRGSIETRVRAQQGCFILEHLSILGAGDTLPAG